MYSLQSYSQRVGKQKNLTADMNRGVTLTSSPCWNEYCRIFSWKHWMLLTCSHDIQVAINRKFSKSRLKISVCPDVMLDVNGLCHLKAIDQWEKKERRGANVQLSLVALNWENKRLLRECIGLVCNFLVSLAFFSELRGFFPIHETVRQQR